MQIQNNYKLINLNTFGINAIAKFFVEIESEKDLTELFNSAEFKNNKKIFLGGGSNILFTGDFDGLVVLNKLKGINIVEDNLETVLIKSMGGEIWNDLVNYAVNKGYWGIENLALIPGTTGAAPMQNIGAYGTELKDTLFSVEAFEIETGEKKIFNKEECELGYRESIFKNKLKGKYFIGAVTLRLSKILKPNISYKILSDYLEKNNINVNISRNISNAVAEIRKSKLPDPKIIGNAGSFFKNVFTIKTELIRLQKNYPEIPYFEEDNLVKIPAGWLIEQCDWKGKKIGNVGVHDKQALVIVNHGRATGKEIIELANKIIVSVKEKFDLDLIPEVNIV